MGYSANPFVFAIQVYTQQQILQSIVGDPGGAKVDGNQFRLEDRNHVEYSPGSPIWKFCGRRARINGTIIWVSKIKEHKKTQSAGGGGGGKGGGGGGASFATYSYTADLAVLWGEGVRRTDGAGEIAAIRTVLANSRAIWKLNKEDQYDDMWDSFVNRLGTATQPPADMLEDEFGVGKVSAHRGFVVSYIYDLDLTPFGNALPGVLQAVVEPNASPYSVADAIADYWNSVPGRSAAADIDVTLATGANMQADTEDAVPPFRGMQEQGPTSVRKSIETICAAYDVTAQQRDGKIYFFDRGLESIITVDADDLEPSDVGSPSRGMPIDIVDRDDTILPSALVVNFRDPKKRFQKNSVSFSMNDVGENIVSVDLPMVLDRKTARRVAQRRLAEAYQQRQEASFKVPFKYAHGQEGDIWAVPMEGQVYYIRATKIDIGADFRIAVTGTVDDVRTGTDPIYSSAAGNLGQIPDFDEDPEDGAGDEADEDGEVDELPENYIAPALEVDMANVPALTKPQMHIAAWLYGHCAEDRSKEWISARLFVSDSPDGPWNEVEKGKVESESELGYVRRVLKSDGTEVSTWSDFAVVARDCEAWDTEHTLRVAMFDGELESAESREQVYSNTRFWLKVGDEIIGYRASAAVTPTVVDLTGMGAEIAHGAGPDFQPFLKLNSAPGGFDFDDYADGLDYVTVEGFSEPKNAKFGKRVKSGPVNPTNLVFDLLVGDDLTDEGPVADDVRITLTVNPGTYDLTDLLRAIRDTGDHSTEHGPASHELELVTRLDMDALSVVKRSIGKINDTFYYKALPAGVDLADAPVVAVTLEGEGLRPFAPAHFAARRDGTGAAGKNVKFRWWHRTRQPFTSWMPKQATQLFEEGKVERYKLRIYSDSALTVLEREVEIVAPDDHEGDEFPAVRTYNYTEGQQTTDGVLGAALWAEVWQVGAVVKRGNSAFTSIGAF